MASAGSLWPCSCASPVTDAVAKPSDSNLTVMTWCVGCISMSTTLVICAAGHNRRVRYLTNQRCPFAGAPLYDAEMQRRWRPMRTKW